MPKDALTPQARHHFTRFDQVDQLVGASEAVPEIGFMARLMALCSLPRTNPRDRKEYARSNGPYTLVMTAGYQQKLPFGNIPALADRVGNDRGPCKRNPLCWFSDIRFPSSCAS